MLTEKEFFTISEINGLIRDVITMGFPNVVWVCGEIQGFDRNKDKKHIFFELCEKDPDSKDVVARIGLVIFAGKKAYIDELLRSAENAFQLKDDIEVKFLCRIDFYPPHGAMRLIVEGIDPVYTLGKIAQEKQRLITLLRKKGILEKNKSTSLPLVPLTVGLITSYDSAAYNDFISELRGSGIGFTIFVRNALMQGSKAESDVCKALDELNRIAQLDAIVITRGGGSIAELSCFDSQKIAEKIADIAVPVLSGIGHEINITVTDLAAHTYQKTPTAIARFLIERVGQFLDDIEERLDAILNNVQEKIQEERQRLKDTAVRVQSTTHHFLKDHHQELIRMNEIIKRQPGIVLRAARADVTRHQEFLSKSSISFLKNAGQKIQQYDQIISIAHPHNTLKRGFSITRKQSGEIIRSINDLKQHDHIITQVIDGTAQSQIRSVTKEGKRERHKV